MPPKTRLVQSQLKRKEAPAPPSQQSPEVASPSAATVEPSPSPSSTTPLPLPPPLSFSTQSAATVEPSPSSSTTPTPLPLPSAATSSAPAPAPTPSPSASTTPAPPPLLLCDVPGTSTAAQTANPEGDVETPSPKPLRSIRCRNKDGKAPAKPRTVRSNKTQHMTKAAGKRLKIEFSTFHKGPGVKVLYDSFVRDIGCAVRDKVPMLASTYGALTDEQKVPLMDYLKMYYDIPEGKGMKDFINKKANKAYGAWKHDCRLHFLEFGGEDIPLEFLMRPEQWQHLVQHEFLDEAKLVLCERNKANRTKNPNPINHHNGSKPLSFRAEELIVKEKHPAGFLQAAFEAYEPCPNAKERVDKLKGRVEEILQAREGDAPEPSQIEPIPVEQQKSILLECLGERRGTEVRGMGGAGERPAKKRGGPWTARAEQRQKELEDARLEAQKAKEEAAEARTIASQARRENEELRDRMAELEKKMMELIGARTVSQPSVTSVVQQPQLSRPSDAAPSPSHPSSQP